MELTANSGPTSIPDGFSEGVLGTCFGTTVALDLSHLAVVVSVAAACVPS
jgi:hypothetical protein